MSSEPAPLPIPVGKLGSFNVYTLPDAHDYFVLGVDVYTDGGNLYCRESMWPRIKVELCSLFERHKTRQLMASSNAVDRARGNDICLLGHGEKCCRYLAIGAEGLLCVKHVPPIRATIDQRSKANTMTARGDNCEGLR